MTLSTTLRALAGALAGTLALAAHAAYPDHPIRLVIPFPTGGSTDVVGRVVALKAQEILGQAIVIDNRGGAGSILGSDIVAKSPADGYTLLVTQTAFAVNASLMKKLPYDTLADFTPIALMASHPGVVVAQSAKPYNTFGEFIAYAKAHPGVVNYSSAGNGTWPHLSMALLAGEAGLNMVHIAYKGTGPAKVDLLAGRVDVKIEAYATTMEMIKAGQLKVLAVTSPKRSPDMPNIPTVAESGIPGYETAYWMGIAGPAGMPADVVAKLEKAFVQASKDPAVLKVLKEQSIDSRAEGAKALDKHTRAEIEKWAKVVRATGIQE
jgi:tripartite-type tricarboxylate transporter receptor subunit TctC